MVDGRSWRRRKQSRPAEMTRAALAVFAEVGFAAAKLEDIARQAGVAKGSLYRYFSSKEELFHAAVRSGVSPGLSELRLWAKSVQGPFSAVAPLLLERVAEVMSRPQLAAVAAMVIGETRNFPDLARIWHDEVVDEVIDTAAELVGMAQRRGEVRDGDPRLYVFSLLGPLLMGMLYREVFASCGNNAAPQLPHLARQHSRTVLQGLLTQAPEAKPADPRPGERA